MSRLTKLLITLRLGPEDEIGQAVGDLPEYCASTFAPAGNGLWNGEFIVTCPVAPALAEGDFEDDLSPHLRTLLELKRFYEAIYVLEIAVGAPAADTFELQSYSVALLAALGASITIYDQNAPEDFQRPARIP
jgi:hypothetical protein